MKPHIRYPMEPVNRMPNASATAARYPMVAMLPLSKYLNGGTFASPSSRALITLPT